MAVDSFISDVKYGRGIIDNNDMKIIDADLQLANIVGLTRQELANISFLELLYEEDKQKICEKIKRGLKDDGVFYLEHRIIAKDNGEILVLLYGYYEAKSKNEVFKIVMADLSRDKVLQSRLEQFGQSKYRDKDSIDVMTGLLSKSAARFKIEEFLSKSIKGQKHALLLIDIDNFKRINDRFGDMFGDTVIENIAVGLKDIFNAKDIIGRVSGDKFIVLIKNSEEEEAKIKATEVCNMVIHSYVGNKTDIKLTCSVGMAYYGKDGWDYSLLFLKANVAMQQSKIMGVGQIYSYEQNMKYIEDKKEEYFLDNKKDSVGKDYDSDFATFAFSLLSNSKQLDSSINLLIDKICRRYNLDYLWVSEKKKKKKTYKQTNVWIKNKGGIQTILDDGEYYNAVEEESMETKFDDRKILSISNIDKSDLPRQTKIFILEKKIKSMISCGFSDENNVIGYVSYCTRTEARDWTEYEKSTFYELTRIISVFVALRKERIHDKAEIDKLTSTDKLTGLYNQEAFKIKSEKLIEEYDGTEVCAIVYSDINDFSYVNENFGYEAGNKILCDFARLLDGIEQIELSCRAYSDFFMAFFIGSSKEKIIDVLAERTRFFISEQKKVYPASDLHLSIGVYFIESNFCDINTAIENANITRKSVKGNKDIVCGVYKEELRERRDYEQVLAGELHPALQNGEIQMYLQPKFSMSTRKIIGAEALSRWKSKNGDIKFPNDFIPVLERVGYIVDLDFYIYCKVLTCIKRWKEEGRKLLPISVNFSRQHVNYDDFVEHVCRLTESYGVEKDLIEIEVTESMLSDDIEKMIKNMRSLRKAGFKIDIDDFGTGYSSLNLLLTAPTDVVKIDRSFLKDIEISQQARDYIKNMGALIATAKKQIIFEGVETEVQAKFLIDCGFDMAQGFLFDKAITVSEYEEKYLGF